MALRPVRLAAAVSALLVAWGAPSAALADCDSPGEFSSCFDADPFWPVASSVKFVQVGPASVEAPGAVFLGLATSHATQSATLELPSPDPRGRQLPVVEHVTTATLLAAWGLAARTEVSLALPWTIDQRGMGLGGVTSQSSDDLRRHPLRDPRVGVTRVLWQHDAAVRVSVATRYTLAVPLGDAPALAGDRTVVGVPGFAMGFARGRFFGAAEASARLREPTRLANARLGSQLVVAAGLGVDLLAKGRLSLSSEAFVAPSLVEQPTAASGNPSVLAPAEWLVSLGSAPLGRHGPTALIAGGGGLPLSTTDGSAGVGMTSPALRLVAIVRQRIGLRRSNR